MQYYIRLRGREDGPFDIEDLKRLRAQGRFSTIHEVSRDRRNWQRAAVLAEVFAAPPGGSYGGALSPASAAVPISTLGGAQPAPEPPRPAAPPPEEWHYSQGGEKYGPFRTDVLQGLLQSGQLPADVHVWTAALGHWMPAEQVPQFAAVVAGRKRRAGGKRKLLIWTISGCAAAVLLAAIALGWALTTTMRNPDVVRGPDDRDGLGGAVGRVFVGFEFSGNGRSIERWSVCGTGFAVSKDGYFITNNHVVAFQLSDEDKKSLDELKASGIESNRRIWVFFGRNDSYRAEVVRQFEDPDLAVLKLDRPVRKYFRLSALKEPKPNSAVWTCGYPALAQAAQSDAERELAKALSSGKTIAMQLADKEFSYSLYHGSVGRAYPEPPFDIYYKVEHDAKMTGGNSGGPLLDANGTVVGINTLGLTKDGVALYNISLSVGSLRAFIEQAGIFAEWVD